MDCICSLDRNQNLKHETTNCNVLFLLLNMDITLVTILSLIDLCGAGCFTGTTL